MSAQLAESLGKKGLDLALAQPEVGCLGDELVHGRAYMLAAGVHLEDRRPGGDKGSYPAPRLDEAVPLEELVDLGRGERVYVELGGEVANGGKRSPMLKLPRQYALPDLLLELNVEGDSAVGVEEEHGVLLF